MSHPSHKTRMSDSSLYDEVCTACGANDGRSTGTNLEAPCPMAGAKVSRFDSSTTKRRGKLLAAKEGRDRQFTFNQYSALAARTAIYPGRGNLLGLLYCALGAAGEAGEIANKVKKILRDDNCVLTPKRAAEIRKEVGGTLWYLAMVADELETTLRAIAVENTDILAGRQERGTLHGSGDER